MDATQLVKMANQIAQYFEAFPNRDEARASVADHLTRFWEPRMRSGLIAHRQATGADCGLQALAAEAVDQLAGR